MPSERTQRHIDRLLDEADKAIASRDWATVRQHAQDVLDLDPGNADALDFLAAMVRKSQADTDVGPPETPGAPAASKEDTQPSSFANGRYSVKRFLGQGGKKRVYLAHDSLLDRDVAFALIKTEGLDDVGRDRIAREAKAMGRLGAHPHIVSVYDLGQEDGQPFIVTELMEGGDVEGLIEKAAEHRPPLDRTLEIGIQVCRGLEFAHSYGIVHRDLKPGNVWLTADGTAKLGDFGLAVALDKTRLTQAGMMVGTVSYMPPEQAIGGEVTPRSDLYSLGALLYELVTGRPPFVGDEAVAIIGQHLNASPVSPVWHNANLPSSLEALILTLLEKDPTKRPESAAAVRESLEHLLSAPQALSAEPAGTVPLVENPMYGRTFVGRESELKQLQTAFDAATSGRGSLALVVGEPGIGKTSVCEQLATYATVRGGRTLVGHCYGEGSLSLPYLPFVEAMRSYALARDPDALRGDLGTGAVEVARIVSEVRERLHIEPSPPNVADADEERYRLFQAVAAFLRSASAVQPLVIVLEDLHDADHGTLDLLVHLARNLSGARLLLIGTYRDVEVDRAHPLSSALAELRRGGTLTRVLLRGLSTDEVQRMMSQLSGQDVPWRLAEAVHRQTEGNPLFIQEVLRYLVEEGLIKREEGRWRRASDETPLELGIPEGLRDVIGKRLSRLSAETNQVLAVAAVMGREFRLDVLQQVAAVDDEALEAALGEARTVAVIEERAAPGGAVNYRFTHAFFRQTLYEETIAPRRIRVHQQVARSLEAVYGRRLEEHAAELAEHYAYSSNPADLAKAVEYGELAAQRAMSVYAYGEAERHLEQALKVQEVLDPDNRARRCDLLLELGETMLPAEEPARVVESAAGPAFRLAEEIGDSNRASRASLVALDGLFRSTQFFAQADRDITRPWTERADRTAKIGSAERTLADAYVGVFTIGDVSPAAGHVYLRRAVDTVSANEDSGIFFRATGLAMARLQSVRDRDRVQSVARSVLERPRSGALSRDLGQCLAATFWALIEAGDRQAAESVGLELEDLAGRTRDSTILVHARAPSTVWAYLGGAFDKVEELAVGTLDLAARLGVQPTWIGLTRVHSLAYRGRFDEAQATPALRAVFGRGAFAASAWLFALLGQYGKAKDFLARFGDLDDEGDETSSVMLAELLESATLGSDIQVVQVLESRLTDMVRFPCVNSSAVCWARILAGAASVLGERSRARERYELAIEQCKKFGNRPELALSHMGLAELLLEHHLDERATAIEHLDFAIREFREMKMQPSLERALRHKEVLKA
jgi:serine/threonine protein kinase